MGLHKEVLTAKAGVADAVFAMHQATARHEQAQKTLALAEAKLAGANILIEAAKRAQENSDAVNVGA